MQLSFRHLVSTKQILRKDVETVLRVSAEMEELLKKEGGDDRLHRKVLASLFYEPSTRTRLSFETAMQRLGGKVVTAEGLQFSSLYKGETLEDTIIVAGQYADVIAMRHPEQGSADRAAAVSPVPFLNAGDGPGQHPTQALLDLFTIKKECGALDGLHVAMVGDLKFGRTVHSLSFLLGLFDNIRFTFIAPKELPMPAKVTDFLKEHNIPYDESAVLEDGLDANILYMTRVQKERFEREEDYERLKDAFILTAAHLRGRNVTVMHPLPRVGEISPGVDTLPNAAYFRQVKNGIPVRMALLALLLDAA